MVIDGRSKMSNKSSLFNYYGACIGARTLAIKQTLRNEARMPLEFHDWAQRKPKFLLSNVPLRTSTYQRFNSRLTVTYIALTFDSLRTIFWLRKKNLLITKGKFFSFNFSNRTDS